MFLSLAYSLQCRQIYSNFCPYYTLLHACHYESCSRTATRLRSASMALVYKKLVHLSNLNTVSTQQVSICVCVRSSHMDWLDFWTSASLQMVTLMGTDGHKVYEAVTYGFHIITAPIVFLYCIVSSFSILSSTSLDAVITMCVFLITCPLLVSFSTAIYLCLN